MAISATSNLSVNTDCLQAKLAGSLICCTAGATGYLTIYAVEIPFFSLVSGKQMAQV